MPDLTHPPGRRKRAAVYVGPVEGQHESGLSVFFRSAWGSDSNPQGIARWRAEEAEGNPAEPGEEPPKWVFTLDGKVVGYLGTIPERFFSKGEVFTAYWLKGFHVLQEFRSGPIGFEIVCVAVKALKATAVSVVAPEARRLFEAMGLDDRGVLFNRLRLLRPGRLLSRLDPDVAMDGLPSAMRTGLRALQFTSMARGMGALLGLFLSAATLARGRPTRGLRITRGWDSLTEEALDALWREFRENVAGATVRDGHLVRWRYARGDRYKSIGVWAGERLRGWAVVRIPSPSTSRRLHGVSVASLSDLLFPFDAPRVGLAVLAAAEALATEMGADALLCSGTHPALEAALARRSFLRLPGNVHFMARDGDNRVFPRPLKSWWMTRGDAQSDGAF